MGVADAAVQLPPPGYTPPAAAPLRRPCPPCRLCVTHVPCPALAPCCRSTWWQGRSGRVWTRLCAPGCCWHPSSCGGGSWLESCSPRWPAWPPQAPQTSKCVPAVQRAKEHRSWGCPCPPLLMPPPWLAVQHQVACCRHGWLSAHPPDRATHICLPSFPSLHAYMPMPARPPTGMSGCVPWLSLLMATTAACTPTACWRAASWWGAPLPAWRRCWIRPTPASSAPWRWAGGRELLVCLLVWGMGVVILLWLPVLLLAAVGGPASWPAGQPAMLLGSSEAPGVFPPTLRCVPAALC